MKPLLCSQCGAPIRPGGLTCPYCGVAFEAAASPAQPGAAPSEPAESAAVPDNWVQHADPWIGFRLSHPPGYRVECLRSVIRIAEDALGATAAWIMPRTLPAPVSLRQFADDFVRWKRGTEPTFTAWLVPDADAPVLSLRTRSQTSLGPLEGSYVLAVDGNRGLAAGFQGPANLAAERALVLTQLLSTLGSIKPMARQPFRDPLESGFQYWIPQGWSASGGTERNLPGGVVRKFAARKDALGLVQAGVPGLSWVFSDGPMAMWGGMGGMQPLPYMPAAEFGARWYVPQAQRGLPGLGVISIQDRPDLLPYLASKLAEEGTRPEGFDLSVAEVVTAYPEGGVGLRQRTRIAVARPRMPMGPMSPMGPMNTLGPMNTMGPMNTIGPMHTMGLGPMNMGPMNIMNPMNTMGPMGGGWWMASPDFLRAPEAEFDTWEPVLAGILDSVQIDPAWVQRQTAWQPGTPPGPSPLTQALGQLGNLISAAAGNRPAQPAAGAAQPEAADNAFYVPAGFEACWRDALSRLYGGRWPADPAPAWERVAPTA